MVVCTPRGHEAKEPMNAEVGLTHPVPKGTPFLLLFHGRLSMDAIVWYDKLHFSFISSFFINYFILLCEVPVRGWYKSEIPTCQKRLVFLLYVSLFRSYINLFRSFNRHLVEGPCCVLLRVRCRKVLSDFWPWTCSHTYITKKQYISFIRKPFFDPDCVWQPVVSLAVHIP